MQSLIRNKYNNGTFFDINNAKKKKNKTKVNSFNDI